RSRKSTTHHQDPGTDRGSRAAARAAQPGATPTGGLGGSPAATCAAAAPIGRAGARRVRGVEATRPAGSWPASATDAAGRRDSSRTPALGSAVPGVWRGADGDDRPDGNV